MAYSVLAEGRGEEELEELDSQIGMAENPELVAVTELRQHQKEIGMVFEDPDAPVEGMPDAGNEEIRGERW